VSEFGDFEEEDAYDVAPADPEQVARRYAQYEGVRWDDLLDTERARRIVVIALLIAWLRRQGHLR